MAVSFVYSIESTFYYATYLMMLLNKYLITLVYEIFLPKVNTGVFTFNDILSNEVFSYGNTFSKPIY